MHGGLKEEQKRPEELITDGQQGDPGAVAAAKSRGHCVASSQRRQEDGQHAVPESRPRLQVGSKSAAADENKVVSTAKMDIVITDFMFV